MSLLLPRRGQDSLCESIFQIINDTWHLLHKYRSFTINLCLVTVFLCAEGAHKAEVAANNLTYQLKSRHFSKHMFMECKFMTVLFFKYQSLDYFQSCQGNSAIEELLNQTSSKSHAGF